MTIFFLFLFSFLAKSRSWIRERSEVAIRNSPIRIRAFEIHPSKENFTQGLATALKTDSVALSFYGSVSWELEKMLHSSSQAAP